MENGEFGLYTVYDTVSEQYGPTFEAVNDPTAARNVRQMRIRAYKDFVLYRIGKFNRRSGELLPLTVLENGETKLHKVEVRYVTDDFEREMKESQGRLL